MPDEDDDVPEARRLPDLLESGKHLLDQARATIDELDVAINTAVVHLPWLQPGSDAPEGVDD
jgi:hypothetical protein